MFSESSPLLDLRRKKRVSSAFPVMTYIILPIENEKSYRLRMENLAD